MDRRLEKQPYGIDAFIVYFASIMFAKTNGSTVRLIHPVAFDTFIADKSQQQWLLRQMVRRLEKHPYGIDAFIVYFSSIMFAKTIGSIVRLTSCCFRYIYCRFFQNKFAMTNGSTIGKTPLCY